jgi:predicted HAD superfamily Cof-like phosphohydrolase
MRERPATDDLVREFHEHPGSEQPVADWPTVPSPDLARHRGRLIYEEFKEVMVELTKLMHSDERSDDENVETLGMLLKELCDLRYVLDGTAVSLGLPYAAAYRAVHKSNMTKVFPDGTFHVNENGKVLKPPGYKPPNMLRFVPATVVIHDAEEVE